MLSRMTMMGRCLFPPSQQSYVSGPMRVISRQCILIYLVSVSAGVSIPFILVAFNFEKVIAWSKWVVARMRRARLAASLTACVMVILFVALAVILSQPLENGIKAGVGIGLGLLSLTAVAPLVLMYVNRWD